MNSLSPISILQFGTLVAPHAQFVLTSHVNPDGDALGSELAMAALLRSMGKQVSIVNHSPTPDNFRWIDPDGEILVHDPARHRELMMNAGVIIVLDNNQPERLRSLEESYNDSSAVKIIVDHHLEPAPMAEYILMDSNATSTGEIIYRIIHALKPEALTKPVARALYAAIMTDTGSFRYPRTVGETYRIVGHLVDAGADPTEIYANIYETWSPGRMRLLGEILDSMKTAYDGRLAYISCTQEFLRNTGTTEADTDNFTVYPMSVEGTVAGMLFLELQDGVKISFRSKGPIPINELAKEFGGNGHLNAAGARLINMRLDDAISVVITAAAKYLQNKH